MLVFKIWTGKEVKDRSIGKVSVPEMRVVMKKCPAVLGKFSEDKDSLLFSVPDEPSEEFSAALMEYANTTHAALLKAVTQKSRAGGARKRRVA